MIIPKRHNRDEIKLELTLWCVNYQQHEFIYAVAYCVGYYGAVDEEILDVLKELVKEGVLI